MHKLLDDYLCKKYPKIFVERNLPPQKSCMHWGLSVGRGWFYLIDTLCANIQSHIDNPPWVYNEKTKEYKKPKEPTVPQVIALQVKEKFGALRFYYKGGDDYIKGMVSLIENLSYNTCEKCGKMNYEVGKNSNFWIKTTCEDHTDDVEGFKLNGDKKLQKIWKTVLENEEKSKE